MTLLKGVVTPAADVEKWKISLIVIALSLLLERHQQFGRLLALVTSQAACLQWAVPEHIAAKTKSPSHSIHLEEAIGHIYSLRGV